MKTTILTAILSLTVAVSVLAESTNSTNVLTNERAQVSYALGMMLGESWKANDITDLDYGLLQRGINDAQSGAPTLMSVVEMRITLGTFYHDLAAKKEKKLKELAKKNLKISDAFLAKNLKKDGVVTLPDGLQYKVITKGSGPSPTDDDTVTVSYEGAFIDGTVFDKSDKTTFQLKGIIPGWREALKRMKVGSQWELFIPPNLAYGASGRPPRIEPNSTLIFKIHLLSFKNPNQPVTSDIIKVPSAEEMKKGAKVEIIKPEQLKKMDQQSQPAK